MIASGLDQVKRRTALPDNPRLTLLIGGARSGKSAHAEQLVSNFDPPWTYIATAQALDEEMLARIAEHRRRRMTGWQTVEAPLDLAGTLKSLSGDQPVVVDCLTLWLSNHLLAGSDLDGECANLVSAMSRISQPVFAVTNEVGLGIVPGDPLSRQFRDAAGKLNQMVVSIAGSVILMTAGIPMRIK